MEDNSEKTEMYDIGNAHNLMIEVKLEKTVRPTWTVKRFRKYVERKNDTIKNH